MGIFLFIVLSAYALIATRLIIVGLDCYDEAPEEVKLAPYWMYLGSVIINAVIWPIGFVLFMLGIGVIETND